MFNAKGLSFLLLLPLIAAFPACGSTSTPSTAEQSAAELTVAESAGGGISAVSLLTEAEVAELLGEPVQEVKESVSGTVSNCTWTTDSFKSIGVLVRTGGSGGESRTIFEQALNSSKSISGVEPETVEGVGEMAYWAGGGLGQMNVLKGKSWVIVTVMPADAKGKSVARQAAQLAADRIP
jgi:hypothetical protein